MLPMNGLKREFINYDVLPVPWIYLFKQYRQVCSIFLEVNFCLFVLSIKYFLTMPTAKIKCMMDKLGINYGSNP